VNNTDIIETRLIQRAQQNDTQAFGELVMAYQSFTYNLALRSLGDPQEAQDAAQEAFLRAWQALPGFRGDCRFSTWLYRIVVNLCFNRRPRLRRDFAAISMDASDEEGWDFPDGGANPLQLVERKEQRAFLHRAIERLPEAYRLLILMRYGQELPYEEIAEILGIPLGTVKTGLFRAKAQLKSTLLDQPETRMEVKEWKKRTAASSI
jgi:RNA polymerase sigma-70 factor, ECF subfamily